MTEEDKTYQINFRHTVPEKTSVELHYVMKEPAKLIDGFLHFPPGCNALVWARLMLGKKDGETKQVTPIDDAYVALDASDYPFLLGQEIGRGDIIILELRNYDSVNEHTITCIVSKRRLE